MTKGVWAVTKTWPMSTRHMPDRWPVKKRCFERKRVTAGEVGTWGKELGNCAHRWTTNDEKNKQALSTLSVFFRLKKKDRQQQKEERSREEDRREGGNQTESKEFQPFDCLSLFFNLKKTLSVESTCLFFWSFVVHWWVHFPSSFPQVRWEDKVIHDICLHRQNIRRPGNLAPVEKDLQPAKPPWTDPGLKSGTGVREQISPSKTQKKKKNRRRRRKAQGKYSSNLSHKFSHARKQHHQQTICSQ